MNSFQQFTQLLRNFPRNLRNRDKNTFCFVLVALALGMLGVGIAAFNNSDKAQMYQQYGISSNLLMQGISIAAIFAGAGIVSPFLGGIQKRIPWLKGATILFIAGRLVTGVAPNLGVFLAGQLITGGAIGGYLVFTGAYVAKNASNQLVARTLNSFGQPAIMVFVVFISAVGQLTHRAFHPTILLSSLFALPLLYVLFAFAPAEEVAPEEEVAQPEPRLTVKGSFLAILFALLNQGGTQPNVVLLFVGDFLALNGSPSDLVGALSLLYTVAGVGGSIISVYVWLKLKAWGLNAKVPLVGGCFLITAVLATMGLQTMHLLHLPWQEC